MNAWQMNFAADDLASSWSVLLADAAWKGTLLLLLAATATCLLRRNRAAVRHMVWTATFGLLLIVPVGSLLLPGWQILPDWMNWSPTPAISAETAQPTATNAADARPQPDIEYRPVTQPDPSLLPSAQIKVVPVEEHQPDVQAGLPLESAPVIATEAPQHSSVAMATPTQQPLWLAATIVQIWIVGCVVCLLRLVASIVYMLGLERRMVNVTQSPLGQESRDYQKELGFGGRVRVLLAREGVMPMAWGLLIPRIVVPRNAELWPDSQRRAVLLHELGHIRRGDPLWQVVMETAKALYWFHPLVWLAGWRANFERERACDDLVLNRGISAADYARHLVDVVSMPRLRSVATVAGVSMASTRKVESRVRCIMDHTSDRRPMTLRTVALVIAATIAVGVPVSMMRGAEPADELPVQTISSSQGTPVQTPSGFPQWGRTSSRNNVAQTTDIPSEWNTKTEENIRWQVKLGSQTYGTPVVAGGKVFIGTNNGHGYLKQYPAAVDLGCLLCFDQETGEFLWQHSNRKLPTGRVHDWPLIGVVSTPLVVGDRLWYVSNRAMVVCLDVEGFTDGENDGLVTDEESTGQHDADVVWQFDMLATLGISPVNMSACSPTTDGTRLFIVTSNGVDETHNNVPAPNAPAFLCLDRATGQVLWTDNSPGGNVVCQWSSPSFGVFDGQPQAIFPGGDGWLYSFDPAGDGRGKSKLLWKFDCNPKDAKWELLSGRRNPHLTMPVIADGKVYVSTGQSPENGEGEADLWCIDPTHRTDGSDVSETLVISKAGRNVPPRRLQNMNRAEGEREIPNPNSAVVWHYTGGDLNDNGELEFDETLHRTLGCPVIADGHVVLADFSGLLHCLDVETGQLQWTYDLYAMAWSTPLIADGKIYVADEDGEVAILELGEEQRFLREISFNNSIYSTPIVADGVLYVSDRGRLYAIGRVDEAESDR